MTRKVDGVVSVSQPVEDRLSERELFDYAEFKRDLVEWSSNVGKEPEKANGYAEVTVQQVSYKVDRFYRWIWSRDEVYTTSIVPADADEYLQELMYSDENHSPSHLACTQKCLKRLFKWRRYQLGRDDEWEPDHTFTQDGSASNPRDYPEKGIVEILRSVD